MASKAKDVIPYDDRQIDIEEVCGSPPLPIDEAETEREIEVIAVKIDIIGAVAVVQIGELLAEARELFRYMRAFGGFSGWVKTRLGRSAEWARRTIAVFEYARDNKGQVNLDLLQPEAQRELATAPKDVQSKVESLLVDGERVTVADIKEMRAERAMTERLHATAQEATARAEAAERKLKARDAKPKLKPIDHKPNEPAKQAKQAKPAEPDPEDDAIDIAAEVILRFSELRFRPEAFVAAQREKLRGAPMRAALYRMRNRLDEIGRAFEEQGDGSEG